MYRPLISVVLSILALDAGAADPDAARSLVVQHCVKCHAVPGYNPEGGPPTVDAPAFEELAGYEEDRLRAFLRAPHWPMTQFTLSPSDIDNLMAYVATLRK